MKRTSIHGAQAHGLAMTGTVKDLKKALKKEKPENEGECVWDKKDRKGKSLLHCAVDGGNVEVIKFLLASGADPNIKDSSSWTPLHLACFNGRLDLIELLLSTINSKDEKNRVIPPSVVALSFTFFLLSPSSILVVL